MTLAARALIQEGQGRVLQMPHREGCDESACPADHTTEGYELFGHVFEIAFPKCQWYAEVCYWTGSRHCEFLSMLFGVAVVTMKEMESIWERHTRAMVNLSALPYVMQRGPWRYYCLRDVVRCGAVPRTHCVGCGARCRSWNLAGESYWSLARGVRQITEWRWEYEYFCSGACRLRCERREQRKEQQERRWIQKSKERLKACRRIIRKQARKPRPV